jgi:hypothetical protein
VKLVDNLDLGSDYQPSEEMSITLREFLDDHYKSYTHPNHNTVPLYSFVCSPGCTEKSRHGWEFKRSCIEYAKSNNNSSMTRALEEAQDFFITFGCDTPYRPSEEGEITDKFLLEYWRS